MTKGLINHILPKSFVDGPGNRAVIFLQGCNFQCAYCHNPYSINECNHCGVCVEECPVNALSFQHQIVVWDETICEECDRCIQVCPRYSTPKAKQMSVNEVWAQITAIQSFISGITISGGEPSLQIPFLVELFKKVKNSSQLTTMIETNGFLTSEAFDPLFPCLDMIAVDLKASDPKTHERLTGKPLQPVLETINYFNVKGKLHSVQQVVVYGYTASKESVCETARLLATINPQIPLKLLRFRPHGTSGEALQWKSPTDEEMDSYVQLAKDIGLETVTRSL